MAKSAQCREGLYALPKTMFDIFCKAYKRRKKFFNSLILDIFQRLGHFLRKGMKPFPALDMRHHISPKDPYKCLIVNGAIMSQQKMTKSGQCREGLYALPKTMFDIFLKAVGLFFSGWGIF